jgi:hypothetical protein
MPSLSFLRDKLTVTALDDKQVSVSVILPADLLHSYCRFLDALQGFFRAADRQSSIARCEVRVNAPARVQQAEAYRAAYRKRLVTAYDAYTAQCLSRKDAMRRIVADLRAENHPWRFLEQVRSELVAAGRAGRSGRPRRRQQ